jgi:peptide deformylase
MAVLDILVYPDPRLKQVSKPVAQFDEGLREFIRDLEETMRAGPGGVGIAAPQVGRFERIVIVDVSGKPKIKHHGRLVLINPEIISQEGSAIGREGCLSVPEYTGNVARAKFITLRAQDEFGKKCEFQMERYEARAVQHEMDHLDGLLLLDRLVSRRDLFRRQTQEAASPKSKNS